MLAKKWSLDALNWRRKASSCRSRIARTSSTAMFLKDSSRTGDEAGGVAGRSGLREDLPIAHAEHPVDPGVVIPPAVDEGRLDPVAIGRPARSRRKRARRYRPECIDAADRRPCRRIGGAGDDLRPCGA